MPLTAAILACRPGGIRVAWPAPGVRIDPLARAPTPLFVSLDAVCASLGTTGSDWVTVNDSCVVEDVVAGVGSMTLR